MNRNLLPLILSGYEVRANLETWKDLSFEGGISESLGCGSGLTHTIHLVEGCRSIPKGSGRGYSTGCGGPHHSLGIGSLLGGGSGYGDGTGGALKVDDGSLYSGRHRITYSITPYKQGEP